MRPKSKSVRPGSTRGQGRQTLLDAARKLFAERGYSGTSTREIAGMAGISEPMLFRHFGSKSKLFEEAVLAPFNNFVSHYMADWAARPRGEKSDYDEAREFYRGVYDVLVANRKPITELIAAQSRNALTDSAAAPQMGAILERFEEVVKRERDERGFDQFDPAVMTRLMFGMVFAVAVHGDWMFEGATRPRPSADAFINEMARMTIYGAYPPRNGKAGARARQPKARNTATPVTRRAR
jgi:AcrR family transcriptional regulator